MKKLIAVLLLLCLTGCGTHTEVPTEAPTATPTEPPMETPTATLPATEAPSSVYTDWSKYTPYQPVQQLYSYHPGYTGEGSFVARDDYGALLPYIGKYATMEMYVTDTLPLYGLVTEKGELVSDPVYTSIFFSGGFLFLSCAESGGAYSLTLAAADGHWVHALSDSYYIGERNGLLLTGTGDGSLDLWNRDGEVVTHFDASLFTPWLGEDFRWDGEGTPNVVWMDDKVAYASSCYVDDAADKAQWFFLYLDLVSGVVTETPPEGYPEEPDHGSFSDDTPEPPEVEGYKHLDTLLDDITGEAYFLGCDYNGGSLRYTLFDGEGGILLENISMGQLKWSATVRVRGGLCSTVEDGCFCYLSVADGTPVFRYAMKTNSD